MHSSSSAWCQAELYYAHALRRMIVPIRVESGQAITMPAPLDLLQRETQYVLLENEEDRPAVVRAVQNRFRVVRRRARLRWAARVAVLFAGVGLLAWGMHSGFANLLHARERKAFVTRIERAQAVLHRDVLDPRIAQFKDDESLRSRLLLMAEDRERPMHTRLNARIIAAALGSWPKRRYLEALNWTSSVFRSGELTDTTFRTGVINQVVFEEVTFSGVFWNTGPDFSMGGASFLRCRFNGGQFARTTVIDSDFTNCLFYGTVLDVTGFGAVRFASVNPTPESDVITDGQVSSLENSTIANCREPAAPDAIDFSGPKNEVMFTGVVFESCSFRGLIRPSWFTKCSFTRCIFPADFPLAELEKGENTVSGSNQLTGPCP